MKTKFVKDKFHQEEDLKTSTKVRRAFFDFSEKAIYSTRILLIPFYVCLAITLVIYACMIGMDTYHMVHDFFSEKSINENNLLIRILAIVDIVMIANLIVMILIGSYSIFVRKLRLETHAYKPQWLDKISSGSLKVKISMSIVGVSSIHLLKIFIEADTISVKSLVTKMIIHAFFIISCLIMAKTDRIIEERHQDDK